MSETSQVTQLLGVVVSLMGRTTFPEPELRKIVAPSSRSSRLLKAYNLCDGSRTRPEVYKLAGVDKDNFNKAVNRWLLAGVLFEIRTERRVVLRHLYPLPA